MARKKATQGSKIQFIRSIPLDMPVDEVLAKAKDLGMDLTKGYVQTTRSGMRKAARKPIVADTHQHVRHEEPEGSDDRTFLVVALGIGLAKARRLIDQAEEQVLKVVNG